MPPTAFPNADPLRQGRFGHCLCWGFRDGVVEPHTAEAKIAESLLRHRNPLQSSHLGFR